MTRREREFNEWKRRHTGLFRTSGDMQTTFSRIAQWGRMQKPVFISQKLCFSWNARLNVRWPLTIRFQIYESSGDIVSAKYKPQWSHCCPTRLFHLILHVSIWITLLRLFLLLWYLTIANLLSYPFFTLWVRLYFADQKLHWNRMMLPRIGYSNQKIG